MGIGFEILGFIFVCVCSSDVKYSQNHTQVERDLKDHQVPTLCEDPYEVLTSHDLIITSLQAQLQPNSHKFFLLISHLAYTS